MADTYKVLGTKTSYSDTSSEILYSVPAGKSAIISNITVASTASWNNISYTISVQNTVPNVATSNVTSYIAPIYASGGTDKILVSSDGLTWAEKTLPASLRWGTDPATNGSDIVLIGQTPVADSKFYAAISKDGGNTWSLSAYVTSNYMPTGVWRLLEAGNNYISVSTGSAYAGQNSFLVSTDGGELWEKTFIPNGGGFYAAAVNTTGNIAVALEYDSNLGYVSTDYGITWTEITLPESNLWYKAIYDGSKFVALAEGDTSAKLITSTNGTTWSTPITLPSTTDWRGELIYGAGKYLITSWSSNQAIISTDLATWTTVTLPETGSWTAGSYNSGKFYLHNYTSKNYATSVDGVTWTLQSYNYTPTSGNLNGIYAMGNLQLYYSPTTKTCLFKNSQIAGIDTHILENGIVLNENNSIVVKGNQANFAVFGVELDEAGKYKKLADADTSESALINYDRLVYTVPTGKTSVVKSINILNPSKTTPATVRLFAQGSIDAAEIFNGEVAAGETVAIKGTYGFEQNTELYINGGTTKIVCSVFGAEL